jgi:hypothetical protein
MSRSIQTRAKTAQSFEITVSECDHDGRAIPSCTTIYAGGFWFAVDVLMHEGYSYEAARSYLNERVAARALHKRQRSTR